MQATTLRVYCAHAFTADCSLYSADAVTANCLCKTILSCVLSSASGACAEAIQSWPLCTVVHAATPTLAFLPLSY